MFEVGDYFSACIETIHALIRGGSIFVDCGVDRENIDLGQVVSQADFIVVEVVRRRDLDASGAELGVYIVVGDNRDLATGQAAGEPFCR